MNPEAGAGTRIGAYILDEPIGRGGFATVWRGHSEETGETVAIKVLTAGSSNSHRALQRAEIELLAAAAVRRSPHAVQVLDGGFQPFPYLIMEFVEGVDFAEVLRNDGPLSAERTIDVGLAVTDALSAMNEAGIIHRDLKPANVMLSDTGVVKLADFGIAKIIGYETVTAAGEIALTMAYAAPEVWDAGDGPYGAPGHRSDLYALAIMLFEFLTGSTPFSGTYTALYRSHREQRPDLSKLPEETPASLRAILDGCLEKNPLDRPRDADVCRKMLRRARIELLESQGKRPAGEPVRFGPWERVKPHPFLPWAWLCRRESTGETATVEVHFAADAEAGTLLRRAVAANPALTALGAERLIETNRLLLRPGEEWTEPPPGQFQFWIARQEEPAPASSAPLSVAELRVLASALIRLIEVAHSQDIALAFSAGDVSVRPGGLHLRRPGIFPTSTGMGDGALAYLGTLSLDAAARRLLDSASELKSLAADAALLARNDETQIAGSYADARTRILDAPARSQACTGCGRPVAESDAFCGNCGQLNRPMAPQCPGCGTAFTIGDAFCGSCGRSLR